MTANMPVRHAMRVPVVVAGGASESGHQSTLTLLGAGYLLRSTLAEGKSLSISLAWAAMISLFRHNGCRVNEAYRRVVAQARRREFFELCGIPILLTVASS
jgi:hypothetical protein